MVYYVINYHWLLATFGAFTINSTILSPFCWTIWVNSCANEQNRKIWRQQRFVYISITKNYEKEKKKFTFNVTFKENLNKRRSLICARWLRKVRIKLKSHSVQLALVLWFGIKHVFANTRNVTKYAEHDGIKTSRFSFTWEHAQAAYEITDQKGKSRPKNAQRLRRLVFEPAW